MCCIYRNLARRTTDIGLFMASVMLPLFLPDGVNFNKLYALIGITMFQSAYMAEVIRGGLQAIPKDNMKRRLLWASDTGAVWGS